MKKCILGVMGLLVFISCFFPMVPSSQAQTNEEMQAMKQFEKEITLFMEKCSNCHSVQRILSKKMSKEEWNEILKMMAGKRHAYITDEELRTLSSAQAKVIPFMKKYEKEVDIFVEKCSGCHSMRRIFSKKRSQEEWDKMLEIMRGKPHATISEEEIKKIQRWIDFLRSPMTMSP